MNILSHEVENLIENYSCVYEKNVINFTRGNGGKITISFYIEGDSFIVNIKGTDEPSDWLTNFNCRRKERHGRCFHEGFLNDWLQIKRHVLEEFKRSKRGKVIFVGFSLGGAVSQVAIWDLITSGYNVGGLVFGCPAVGCKKSKEDTNKAEILNISHICDPVPVSVPLTMRLFHYGTRLFIDDNGIILLRSKDENYKQPWNQWFKMILGLTRNIKNHSYNGYKNILKITKGVLNVTNGKIIRNC